MVARKLEKPNNETRKAVEFYQKALELKPLKSSACYLGLARALTLENKILEAFDICNKAIEVDAANSKIYLTLANLHSKNNNIVEAIKAYQKAIALEPNLPFTVYRKLEASLRLLGRFQEADYYIQSAPPVKEGNKYLSIWNNINNKNIDSLAENHECQIEIDFLRVKQYCIQNSNYKIFHLNEITEAESDFLFHQSLFVQYLKLNITENLNCESELDRIDFTNHSLFGSIDEFLEKLGERTYFQSNQLTKGVIQIVCPSTGKILQSSYSFPFGNLKTMNMGCYRFVGQEVFYLITGRPWFEKHCLYFPEKEIVIYLSDIVGL